MKRGQRFTQRLQPGVERRCRVELGAQAREDTWMIAWAGGLIDRWIIGR